MKPQYHWYHSSTIPLPNYDLRINEVYYAYLDTPEVEQPSCKFCSEEWLKRELVWDDQSNLEVCNGNIEVELYDPVDEGYSYATFEIKFCPMCGERLETNQ